MPLVTYNPDCILGGQIKKCNSSITAIICQVASQLAGWLYCVIRQLVARMLEQLVSQLYNQNSNFSRINTGGFVALHVNQLRFSTDNVIWLHKPPINRTHCLVFCLHASYLTKNVLAFLFQIFKLSEKLLSTTLHIDTYIIASQSVEWKSKRPY